MDRGWIKVHRKIMDSRLSPKTTGRRFTSFEAWLYLLINASHKDHQCGDRFVKRGQILTSKKRLADTWKWDHKKVSRFLDNCQKQWELAQHVYRWGCLITLCNYATYQGSAPSTPQQLPTIKKGKEGKKDLGGEKKSGQEQYTYPEHLNDWALQQEYEEESE